MTPSKNNFKRAKPALGTVVEVAISAIDTEEGIRATDEAFKEIRRLEKIFSFYDPESELSRINACGPEEVCRMSPDLAKLVELALQIEKESEGAFRVCPTCTHDLLCFGLSEGKIRKLTSGCKLDLGGIAKGFIVDSAFEKLAPLFAKHLVTVNAGGDLRTSGEIVVEVRVPEIPSSEKRFEVKMRAGALATSFWRGQSMVGIPSAAYSGVASDSLVQGVSVFADTCAVADAVTKGSMFGKRARDFSVGLRVREVWPHS